MENLKNFFKRIFKMKKIFLALFALVIFPVFSAGAADVFVTKNKELMNHIQKYMERFKNDECFRNVYGTIPWYILNDRRDPYAIDINYLTTNDLGGKQNIPLESWITIRHLSDFTALKGTRFETTIKAHPFSKAWYDELVKITGKEQTGKNNPVDFFTQKEIAALDKKYSKEIKEYKKSRMVFDLYTFYIIQAAHPDKISNATMEKYLKELIIKSGSNRNAILKDLENFKTRIQQSDSPYSFITQDGEQYVMCKNMN